MGFNGLFINLLNRSKIDANLWKRFKKKLAVPFIKDVRNWCYFFFLTCSLALHHHSFIWQDQINTSNKHTADCNDKFNCRVKQKKKQKTTTRSSPLSPLSLTLTGQNLLSSHLLHPIHLFLWGPRVHTVQAWHRFHLTPWVT